MSRPTSLAFRFGVLLLLATAGSQPAVACEDYRAVPVEADANAAYRTPDGRVRIVGYNDMSELLTTAVSAFGRHHPQLRFDLVLEGTRTAPPALTAGTSLLAPMGAEWEAAPLAAYRVKWGRDPIEFKVAHASLNPSARSSPSAVIVHKDNPLAVLTMDQVRSIFTGPITDWSELAQTTRGPIHPIGFAAQTAIGQFLRKSHFAGRPFTPDYVGKPQSREVVDAVAADPAAIGLANLNHADVRVKVIGLTESEGKAPSFGTRSDIVAGRYPLDRHLLIYAASASSGRLDPVARQLLSFILSCEGQAIIGSGSLGYLPLNQAEVQRELKKLH